MLHETGIFTKPFPPWMIWFAIFHRSCRQIIHTFCASGKWLKWQWKNQLFEDASPLTKMRSFAPNNCGQIEGFSPGSPSCDDFRWASCPRYVRYRRSSTRHKKKKFAPDAALSIPCNPWCCELGSVVRWWLSRYHLPPRTAIYLQYSQPSSLAYYSGVLHQHPA